MEAIYTNKHRNTQNKEGNKSNFCLKLMKVPEIRIFRFVVTKNNFFLSLLFVNNLSGKHASARECLNKENRAVFHLY